MRIQEHLFELVQSLSMAEKRHFRKGLSANKRGGKHQYLALFDAIAAQRAYNEQTLKIRFAGTSFAKSLAFPKVHLYKLLLKSLQSYHAERASPSRFRAALDQIDLLMERGLPQQALRRLEGSLKHAKALEQAEQVLQLMRRQRRLTLQIQPPEFAEQISALSQEETAWEKAFSWEQEAVRLHDEVYATFQTIRRKTETQALGYIKTVKKRLDSLLGLPNLPFPAKVAALRGLAHYHHMHEDYAGVHDAYQQEVQTWEAHPLQIKAHSRRHLRAIVLWLNSKALISDFTNLLVEIKALRKRKGLDTKSQAEIFQTTWNLELFYYLNSEQTQLALPLIPQLEEGLKFHANHLLPSAKLGFYYNLSLVCWTENLPERALQWINQILHFPAGEIRKDIRNLAPILEMVLHFELGNIGVLESWFRSHAYRKRTKGSGNPLEALVLQLLQDLLGSNSPSASRYRQFLQDLEALRLQPNVAKLGFETLRKWANGQIS